MNRPHLGCPPLEELSALFDRQAGRRSRRLQQHVGTCPECAATLARFATLRQRLQPLRECGEPGIAQAVLLRLPRERPRPRRSWWGWRPSVQLGVRALGGAAGRAPGGSHGRARVGGGRWRTAPA